MSRPQRPIHSDFQTIIYPGSPGYALYPLYKWQNISVVSRFLQQGRGCSREQQCLSSLGIQGTRPATPPRGCQEVSSTLPPLPPSTRAPL